MEHLRDRQVVSDGDHARSVIVDAQDCPSGVPEGDSGHRPIPCPETGSGSAAGDAHQLPLGWPCARKTPCRPNAGRLGDAAKTWSPTSRRRSPTVTPESRCWQGAGICCSSRGTSVRHRRRRGLRSFSGSIQTWSSLLPHG